MIKIAIAGIGGRMGASIYASLQNTDLPLELTLATARQGSSLVGKSVAEKFGGESSVIITEQLSADFDVLIDFTNVNNTLKNIEFCKENKKAIVVGTTGFTQEQQESIETSSKNQPIFLSANMSIGVNIMQNIVATAAAALKERADIEIVEAHHKAKVDAPSGTALMIGNSIANSLGVSLTEKGVYAREGITGERQDGTIGFSTIRGGDVVGEHTAYYYMAGERLEITHRATDRKIFATGALFAATYLSTKGNGLYSMSDALELKRNI